MPVSVIVEFECHPSLTCFIICSLSLEPPPPFFFFLFLPAAVAMATRYLYLLTWQKLFHLNCLLCIHKSERSRGRGGWSANGLLNYLSPLQVTRQEGARKTDSGVIFIMQDGGTCRERERKKEREEKKLLSSTNQLFHINNDSTDYVWSERENYHQLGSSTKLLSLL